MSENAVILAKSNREKCAFCSSSASNPAKFGEKYRICDLVVHYYCVLLSRSLPQNGQDHEGINGFLYPDIQNSLKRARSVDCKHCRKPGAASRCHECRITFHLPCGIKAGAISQFRRDFPTFCRQHRPQQVIPSDVLSSAQTSSPSCAVCFEAVSVEDDMKALWAPCCRKHWYHRYCLQEMAINMGSLFKCAVCGNKQKFYYWMTRYGIYVPQRDASWEMEPSAFEQQINYRCDVKVCVSPYGRTADRCGSMWEILVCQSCGYQGTHIRCSKLKFRTTYWECPDCHTTTTRKIFKAIVDNFHDDGKKDNDGDGDEDLEVDVVAADSDADVEIKVVSSDSDSDVEVV